MNIRNAFILLDERVLLEIFAFLGPGHYRYVAVNKQFRQSYLKAFPENKAVYGKNAVASVSRARIALEEANDWWLCGHSVYYYWSDEGQDTKAALSVMAARYGQLDVLEWCRANGFPWHQAHADDVFQYDFPEDWTRHIWKDQACEAAARNGHLDVVIWARKRNCPWDAKTCAAAALGGHLKVLKWAHENGCPWSEETCTAAAFGGHLEVLKYARQQNCPWNHRTCEMACKNGHLSVLKWAYRSGCEWPMFHACSDAARHGNLDMMLYAIENGCPFNQSVYAEAARHDHVHILEWGIQRGDDVVNCSWPFDVCECAAAGGKLAVVKWAHENGYDRYEQMCLAAARHGRANILTWAYENGVSWDACTCEEAVSGGWLHLLQWLTAHGCPWSSDILVLATRAACQRPDNIKLLKWVLSNENYKMKKVEINRCIDLCLELGNEEILNALLQDYYGEDLERKNLAREQAVKRNRQKWRSSVVHVEEDSFIEDDNSDSPRWPYEDCDCSYGDY